MKRLWKWLRKQWKEDWPFYIIIGTGPTIIITAILTSLIINYFISIPQSPIVNYDKQMKILADKIDEQGQLIGAYKFRYIGLHKLGESDENRSLHITPSTKPAQIYRTPEE